jgi:hypothetical protein
MSSLTTGDAAAGSAEATAEYTWLLVTAIGLAALGVVVCLESIMRLCLGSDHVKRYRAGGHDKVARMHWGVLNASKMRALRMQVFIGCMLMCLYMVPRAVDMMRVRDISNPNSKLLCHARQWLLWMGLAILQAPLVSQLWVWHCEVVYSLEHMHAVAYEAAAGGGGARGRGGANNHAPGSVFLAGGEGAGPGGGSLEATTTELFGAYGLRSSFAQWTGNLLFGSRWPLVAATIIFQFVWTTELQVQCGGERQREGERKREREKARE